MFDIVNNAASLTVLESGFKEGNGTKKEPGENDISFIITPNQHDIMRIISDIKAALEDPWEYRYTECLEYGQMSDTRITRGCIGGCMLEQRKIDALENWAWIGKSIRPYGIMNIDWSGQRNIVKNRATYVFLHHMSVTMTSHLGHGSKVLEEAIRMVV